MTKEMDKATWVKRSEGEVWLDNEVKPTLFNVAPWMHKKEANTYDFADAFDVAMLTIASHLGVDVTADDLEAFIPSAMEANAIIIEDLFIDPKRLAAEHPFPAKLWVTVDFAWVNDILLGSPLQPLAQEGAGGPIFTAAFPAREFEEIRNNVALKLSELSDHADSMTDHVIYEEGTENVVNFAKLARESRRFMNLIQSHASSDGLDFGEDGAPTVSFDEESKDVIDVMYDSEYRVHSLAFRKDALGEPKLGIDGLKVESFSTPIKEGIPALRKKAEKISVRARYYVFFHNYILDLPPDEIIKHTQPTISVHEKKKEPSALDFGDDDIPEDVMTATEKALEDSKLTNGSFLLSLALKENADRKIQQAVSSDLEAALQDAVDGNLTSKEMYLLLLSRVGMQTFAGLVLSCIAAKVPVAKMSDFIVSAISEEIGFVKSLNPIDLAKKIGEEALALLENPLLHGDVSPEIMYIWGKDLFLSTVDYMAMVAEGMAKQFVALVKKVLVDFVLAVVKTILESCRGDEENMGKENINLLLTNSSFNPTPTSIVGAPDDGTFEEFLNLLEEYLDALSALLTPAEICALLEGEPSDDVVALAQFLLEQPKFSPLLEDTSVQAIIAFFVSIGKNVNPGLCNNVAATFEEIGEEEVCLPPDAFNARKNILAGAGLSPDQIQNEIDKHRERQLGLAKEVFDFANSGDSLIDKYLPEDMCDMFASISIPSLDYAAKLTAKSSIDPVVTDFNSEFRDYIGTIKSGQGVYKTVEDLFDDEGSADFQLVAAQVGLTNLQALNSGSGSSGDVEVDRARSFGIGQIYRVGGIIEDHFSAPIEVKQVSFTQSPVVRYIIDSSTNHVFFDQLGITKDDGILPMQVDFNKLTINPYSIALTYPKYKKGAENFIGSLIISESVFGDGKKLQETALVSTSSSIESYSFCQTNEIGEEWNDSDTHLRSIAFGERLWTNYGTVIDADLEGEAGVATPEKIFNFKLANAKGVYGELFEAVYNGMRKTILDSVFWDTVGQAIKRPSVSGEAKNKILAAAGFVHATKEELATIEAAKADDAPDEIKIEANKLKERFAQTSAAAKAKDVWDILYDLFMFDFTVKCPDGEDKKKHILDFEALKEQVLSSLCVVNEESLVQALKTAVLLMLVRVYISEYLFGIIFAADRVDLRGNPTNYVNYLAAYMRNDIKGRFGPDFLEVVDGLIADYVIDAPSLEANSAFEPPPPLMLLDSDGTSLEVQAESPEESYAFVLASEWGAVFNIFYDDLGLGLGDVKKTLATHYLTNHVADTEIYDTAAEIGNDERFGEYSGNKLILEKYLEDPEGNIWNIGNPDLESDTSILTELGWQIGYRLSLLVHRPKPYLVLAYNSIMPGISYERVLADRAWRLWTSDPFSLAGARWHYIVPLAHASMPYADTPLNPELFLSLKKEFLLGEMGSSDEAVELFGFIFDISHVMAQLTAVMHVDTLNSYSTRNSFALTKLSIKNVFDSLASRGDPTDEGCGEPSAGFGLDESFKLGCSDLELAVGFGFELDFSGLLCGGFDFAWKSKIAKLAREAIMKIFRGLAFIVDPAVRIAKLLAAIDCIEVGKANMCDIVFNELHPFPLGFGPPITPIGAAYLSMECKFGSEAEQEECTKTEEEEQ